MIDPINIIFSFVFKKYIDQSNLFSTMLIVNHQAKKTASQHFDLIIIGAGPVGQILVSLLKSRSKTCHLRVALIDHREQGSPVDSSRILALSEGTRQILEQFFPLTPIDDITSINVSSSNQFGETELRASDISLTKLGFVISYRDLVMSLDKHISMLSQQENLAGTQNKIEKNLSLFFFDKTEARDITEEEDQVKIFCQNSEKENYTLTGNLVICSEGEPKKNSSFYVSKNHHSHQNSIQFSNHYESTLIEKDYNQIAITARVSVSDPQKGKAFERFTADGAIALLPISNVDRGKEFLRSPPELINHLFYKNLPHESMNYSLVWSGCNASSKRRLALNDMQFMNELQSEFGSQLGCFTKIGLRSSFKLKMSLKQNRISRNIISVGNAAQILHPITAQGLNLGFRDALTLSNYLADFGANSLALDEYQKTRYKDRSYTANLVDFFAEGFQNKNFSFSSIKGKLIFSLNFLPKVKSIFIHQMIFGSRD